MNDSINQYVSSLFVTAQVRSEKDFHLHLNSSIEKTKSNAPTVFTDILFLLRSINHGNAIISIYGTNYEYVIPLNDDTDGFANAQSIIYNDNCSCGLHQNCTTQAIFIGVNSSDIIPIKGLKMGCIPSESFRASTLECFYDLSCIHLLQKYTNFTNRNNSTTSLSSSVRSYESIFN